MNRSFLFVMPSSVLQSVSVNESASVCGYIAIIRTYNLPIPEPEMLLVLAEEKHFFQENIICDIPFDSPLKSSLFDQLVLAITYEGINLLVLKKLFDVLSESDVMELLLEDVNNEHCRKLWFLYEWFTQNRLPIDDLEQNTFVPVVDDSLQFCVDGGVELIRYGVVNNLPGNLHFCPLIRKTPFLLSCIADNISAQKSEFLNTVSDDTLVRASSYLLLKDTVASFSIEGEHGKDKRTRHWAEIIGQAGEHVLSLEEFERLQKIVIENDRFIHLGYRTRNGYVGSRENDTLKPVPDHISAKYEDLQCLMEGLLSCYRIMMSYNVDPVLIASVIAFGFVFIHPFEDGNGRIHRYLIHHIFSKTGFSKHGVVFPISASMLTHIDKYRETLEAYSRPLLQFIEWEETENHNVNVLNDTVDYYRYFDATTQAEFLYGCVADTLAHIIPDEVNYLTRYETFKNYIQKTYKMPEQMIRLLAKFLEQNDGKLSKRARKNEFCEFSAEEVLEIETQYAKSYT